MTNAKRGRVVAKNDGKGNLTLQLPAAYSNHYYGTKQKYISFGAKDTDENMIEAMKAALELQSDLESGKFDPKETDKYKHKSKRLGDYNRIEDISVIELCNDFVKSLIIEVTTYNSEYKTLINHVNKMVAQCKYTLKQQSEIDTWIRTNVAESNAIRLLALVYRMIEWGKRESKISNDFPNKFKQYEQDFIKSLRGQKSKRKAPIAVAHLPKKQGIQAHSEEYRDKIIAAFHKRTIQLKYRSKLDHFAYMIEFLFLTGCRHGEAFGLVWKDIEYGKDKKGSLKVNINIDESYQGRGKITKNTKTRKHRKVPATKRVIEILEILKPEHSDPNLLVFRNFQGKHFNTNALSRLWIPKVHDAARRVWDNSVLGKMIKDGEIDYYMESYSTRRTFVSLQINKGVPLPTVAMWIGDDPKTVLKHYARPDYDTVPY
jgi:integrase